MSQTEKQNLRKKFKSWRVICLILIAVMVTSYSAGVMATGTGTSTISGGTLITDQVNVINVTASGLVNTTSINATTVNATIFNGLPASNINGTAISVPWIDATTYVGLPASNVNNTAINVTSINATTYYNGAGQNVSDVMNYPQQPYTYLITNDSGIFHAKNASGAISFTSTDFSVVFNDVLRAMAHTASSSGGGTIELGTGIFNITSPISFYNNATAGMSNINVIGQSVPMAQQGGELTSGTVLILGADVNIFQIGNHDSSTSGFNCSELSFSNMILDGNGHSGSAFWINNSAYMYIDQVEMTGFNRDPVDMYQSDSVFITYSAFYNNSQNNLINSAEIHIANGNTTTAASSQIHIDYDIFGTTDSNFGILLDPAGASTTANNEIWITDNHFENLAGGQANTFFIQYLSSSTSGTTTTYIENNAFGQAYGAVNATHTAYTHFTDNDVSTSGIGLSFYGGYSNAWVITENCFRGNPSSGNYINEGYTIANTILSLNTFDYNLTISNTGGEFATWIIANNINYP